MASSIFNNAFSFASANESVLAPEIAELIDETVVSYEYRTDALEKMGYTREVVKNPQAEYGGTVFGAPELSEITEDEVLPILPTGVGNKKTYKIREFGNKIKVTKLMYDWLGTTETIAEADSMVQSEFSKLRDGMRSIKMSAIKRMNFEATRVLTDGRVATASDGPGSPTPNGVALFSDSHPYTQDLVTAETFQNVLGNSFGTADKVLDATSLQNALNVLKSEVRTQVGDRIMTPSRYILLVSRRGAVNARQILNTAGSNAGIYSGTGDNAAALNTFSFDGNIVEIVEVDALGATSKQGNIGTDDYWFLVNAEAMAQYKALKYFELNNGEFNMRRNDDTNAYYTSLYKACAFDHYNAEMFIVGSRGTVS